MGKAETLKSFPKRTPLAIKSHFPPLAFAQKIFLPYRGNPIERRHMGRKSKGEGTHSKNSIREVRVGMGMTLAELSAKTGISTSQLSRLELARRPTNIDMLGKIAKAFGRPTSALLATRLATGNLGLNLTRIEVSSFTQTDAWNANVEWEPEDQFEITLQDNALYPGAPRRASVVRGDCMNKVYPEGSILVWVPQSQINEPVLPNRRYIVDRFRRNGEIERTVRSYARDTNDRQWFYPESSDDTFRPFEFEDTPECTITLAGRVISSFSRNANG